MFWIFSVYSKIGNLRLDKKTVRVKLEDKVYDTGRKKFGVVLEDNVNTGCNVALNPGTYLKKNTLIYIDPDSFKQKTINQDKI